MGGCCCSARKSHLHGTPVYYYCPPALEERESLTLNDGTAASLGAGFLAGFNLETSTPDAYQPPPAPLPYDVVFGPMSTDSESGRKTVSGSSFETLITREDLEESDCKAQANSELLSTKKIELSKSNECHVLMTEEEEKVCPICLEEYEVENPKTVTKCEHHFHLSCILEWMERSDTCPICDQLGMGSALETLCGQAFGAGQVEMLGVYMQRSWIILGAACFFLLPLYIFAKPILILLGQEHDIAALAGTFTVQTIPQMFSLAINFPTQKFLQAQSKVGVLAWIGFAAVFIHVGILYLFIRVFGWGTGAAAAAYDISAWGIALAQVAYVVGWCDEGWRGLSWLAFKDLWAFVKLSIASAIMLCLEIWYFMTIIVLTGHLDNPVIAVGSLSICMNVNGWEGMLFIGINAAISVRVSNELGSGHPRAAKFSVIVTVIESLLIGILCGAIILITKDDFAVIFTDSAEMKKAVSHLAYLLGATMVLNSVQPVISGVAVGGGWQALVAYINLFCYYIIGLPLGFLLGYKLGLRVEGIWIGMICGTLLQTMILLYMIYKTNWNEEVEQATERMRKWTGQEFELASS